MIILLIRHGQSEADLLDVHEGRADFSLTALGHQQAEAMALHVAEEYNVQRLISSPLIRAFQTAEHLSRKSGITIETEPLLMEFNNGLLAGMDRKSAEERFPYIPDLPVHQSLYQQESKLEFRFRAETILSKVVTESVEDSVTAIVSHGGMINQLFHAFLKLPMGSRTLFHTGDAGIHEWRVKFGCRHVVYVNRSFN